MSGVARSSSRDVLSELSSSPGSISDVHNGTMNGHSGEDSPDVNQTAPEQ